MKCGKSSFAFDFDHHNMKLFDVRSHAGGWKYWSPMQI